MKKVRADFESGNITSADLKAVEDKCILDLVAKQKAAGYHVITDGEFRRATWHLDFMWGFHGVGHSKTLTGLPFHGEAAMIDDTYLTSKVSVESHPFVEHFRFVHALEDENTVAKQTIPAPAQFLEQMIMPFALKNTRKYYKFTEELVEDIAQGYQKVIADLYAAGNFHSTYASSGAYDGVAKTLFARENVSAYYLEFDDERSGGFEPLAEVSGDKKVVLGLITTKSPKLEDKQTVIDRIHKAAQYLPLDRLCLSPQCGFASCEIGNKLTEEEQWAKLALVKEIAEEVWGEEK